MKDFSTEEILKIRKERMLPSVTHYYRKPLRPVKASMQWVWDDEGKKYEHIDEAEFFSRLDADEFLEYAHVHGHYYGTPKHPALDQLEKEGRDVLLEIDVQGAETLRAKGVEGVFVFIAPPSMRDLRRRLVARGTDSPAVVERRMRNARREMRHAKRYDRVVVNDDLSRAIAEVRSILGLRPSRRTARGASSRARSRRRVA